MIIYNINYPPSFTYLELENRLRVLCLCCLYLIELLCYSTLSSLGILPPVESRRRCRDYQSVVFMLFLFRDFMDGGISLCELVCYGLAQLGHNKPYVKNDGV